MDDLGKTRESLVAAETSQKHLQERVNDLVKQVKTSGEKLAVYERRTVSAGGTGTVVQDDMNRDQQLESEVAELRLVSDILTSNLACSFQGFQGFVEGGRIGSFCCSFSRSAVPGNQPSERGCFSYPCHHA